MKIGKRIVEFFETRRAYKLVASLDDAALKDIGITRGEIKSRVYGRG